LNASSYFLAIQKGGSQEFELGVWHPSISTNKSLRETDVF
jgi:hypothetical protein